MKKYAGLVMALVASLLLTAIVVMPSVIEAARRPKVDKKAAAFNYTVQGQSNDVTVGQSMQNDTSPPLRDMKQKKVEKKEKEGNENPKVPASLKHKDKSDEAVQGQSFAPQVNMPATSLNFDGIPFPGVGCNCAPPDTNGEVGATQYVQIVNEGYQVFNKSTGASQLGPSGIATLWSGFGGVCETAGNGDPVVMYDQIDNRWIISQFAGTSVPTDECIAV